MKNVILFASIIVAGGILLVNIYTSLIDSKSWGSDIPASIGTAREYFKSVNPGDFFRLFSPLNQVLGLITLILFWKTSSAIRLYLGMAFALYVAGDIFTFTYFYPRNDIMFKTADLTDSELLRKTWSEWNTMNWIRSLIVLAGLILSAFSLHLSYLLNRQ